MGVQTLGDHVFEHRRKQEERNAIIEECARVAEEHDIGQGWGDAIAAAIRALKDKPHE